MEQMEKKYDFIDDAMKEFDGGVFADKLTAMVQEVASGVHDYDGKGKVTIDLEMKRIKNTNQIMLSHSLELYLAIKEQQQAA